MKSIQFAFLLVVSALIVSCNQQEIEQLRQENARLKTEVSQKDQQINSIIELLNEIEDNLSAIRTREQRLLKAAKTTESTDNQIDQIKSDISAIDEMMRQNRENLDLLAKQVKNLTGEKSQLEKLISNLNKTIENKDNEIRQLVEQLQQKDVQIADLYQSVTELKRETTEKEKVIRQQDKQLHTAYYIIDDLKNLLDKGIVVKSGGLLGIGKTIKVADQLTPEDFTTIDTREVTSFDINARKIQLFTYHPSDSYIIRKSTDGKIVESFEISRPDEFWKVSKYLVIALN